jgi:hypothetical protein
MPAFVKMKHKLQFVQLHEEEAIGSVSLDGKEEKS